jgi:hypothetical protein
LALLPALALVATAGTLKEQYDRAGPAPGYDRYIVLETGVAYTGGLWLGRTFNRITAEFEGPCETVRIVGRGAILDLEGGELTIAYCQGRLDLEDCIVLNGDVAFRGYLDGPLDRRPTGSVRHVTFYRPHDYGVRLFGCGAGIQVERNLVVDALQTGDDFMFLSGVTSPWLPTGATFCGSLQDELNYYENWSFHSDPLVNSDPLRHFLVLCDFG